MRLVTARGGRTFLPLAFCILASAIPAHASLVRDPRSAEDTGAPFFVVEGTAPDTSPALALREHRVEVDIAGVVAHVHVTQVYANSGTSPVDATYVFPAGTRAAVHALDMTVGTHVVRAVLKERSAARADYEGARARGKTAGLLEQQRPNVLSMQVANILPGDTVTVDLRYLEVVRPSDGVYTFVNPGLVGPRYASAEDADEPVTSPSRAPPHVVFDLAVHVDAGLPIMDVASPSHRVGVATNARGGADVVLDGTETDAGTRDFVVRYRLAGDAVATGVMAHDDGEETTVLALVQPPARVETDDLVPREYVFVVDVSGSMQGMPLDTAKSLVRALAAELRPVDRFNVVLFESAPVVLSPSSVPATADNVERALQLLDGSGGGGGTEMLAALRKALALPRTRGMSRSVLLVTDGYVNVEHQAYRLVREHLDDMNVFAFGIGNNVNRELIESVARAGMGEAEVVLLRGDTAAAAQRFWKRVRAPVMTGIQVRVEGAEVVRMEPPVQPDLFAAGPVEVLLQLRGKPRGTLVVTGHTARGPVMMRQPLETTDGEHPVLPLLMARQRIGTLTDLADARKPDEHRTEVLRVALKHGLLSPYTAFVAVDERERNPVAMSGPAEARGPRSRDVRHAVANRGLLKVVGRASAGEAMGGLSGAMGMGVGTMGYGSGGGGSGAGRGAAVFGAGGLGSGSGTAARQGPAPVTMRVGDVEVRGADMTRPLKAKSAAFRRCYEKALARKPALSGRVVLVLHLDGSGRVVNVTTDGDTLGDASLTGCLSTTARGLVLPSTGGTSTLRVPLVFRPAT